MSEQLQETPASLSPVSRFIGVIVSPQETFKDIERKPGWLFPLVAYFFMFAVALSFYSSKADWVAIVTDQIQSSPLMKILPEQAQDQAVERTTATFKKLSSAQVSIQNIAQVSMGIMLVVHFLTIFWSSLFVLMGSLKDLKLGRAWLNFVICALLYVVYLVINSAAAFAFFEEPSKGVMINAISAVILAFAWGWLLHRFARNDLDFRRMLGVTTHGAAIWTVSALALLAISIATPAPIVTPPNLIVRSNLGALIHVGIPALKELLRWLDFFTIWWLIVLSVGFRVTSRVTSGAAAAIVFIPWALLVLVNVAISAVFG